VFRTTPATLVVIRQRANGTVVGLFRTLKYERESGKSVLVDLKTGQDTILFSTDRVTVRRNVLSYSLNEKDAPLPSFRKDDIGLRMVVHGFDNPKAVFALADMGKLKVCKGVPEPEVAAWLAGLEVLEA